MCIRDRWTVGQEVKLFISLSLASKKIFCFCFSFFGQWFTVVSIHVDSIQIEVVSRHHRSRFDTYRKSIRFNSIHRPVAGGEAVGPRAPPEIFRFESNSATKVEFCLLKWTAVHGSYSFQVLSITVRLCTVVLLCNLELCKGAKSHFWSAKNNQEF